MNTTKSWAPEDWVPINKVTCPSCRLPVWNSKTTATRDSALGIQSIDKQCACGKKYTLVTAFSEFFGKRFVIDIIGGPDGTRHKMSRQERALAPAWINSDPDLEADEFDDDPEPDEGMEDDCHD
jgi:hypothetical protein